MKGCPPTPAPAVIDIWAWFLDQPAETVRRCASLLSADEILRANRFLAFRDGEGYVVARAVLRVVLAGYLDTCPEDVALAYNDFGKPYVAGCGEATPLHFNLSHSGSLAVLAVSDQFPLGIDIEEISPLKEDIAGHFFSAREQTALRNLPPDQYLRGFYRCWTRKEALVKGYGEGLSMALDSFDVSVGEEPSADLSRVIGQAKRREGWRIWNLDAPAGFEGALAALSDGRPVHLRYYSNLLPGSCHYFFNRASTT